MSTHAPSSAEVIPFPSRAVPRPVEQPVKAVSLKQIDNAQDFCRAIVEDLEITRHMVAKEGRSPSACGGTRTGRTLSFCCQVAWRLIALRNNPADRPLSDALREWLVRNGANHG